MIADAFDSCLFRLSTDVWSRIVPFVMAMEGGGFIVKKYGEERAEKDCNWEKDSEDGDSGESS